MSSNDDNTKHVRTRFAPSPTGYMHIGNLRTALYAYLFARHNAGSFFLRIEDTDRSRYVPGAEEKAQELLKRFGLFWDNEEVVFQSKRLPMYKKYADQLVSEGKAYPCFCSSEDLDVMRKEQQEKKLAPKYDRRCLRIPKEEAERRIAAGESHTVRFRIPEEEVPVVEFMDAIRGRVEFRTDTVDDQVLLKSDGFPTYHLAVVVDDHEMEITHVIRGEEWLPSTPKHLLLYRAFGWEAPIFAHLSIFLNADRSKLSKRQGDVAVTDYLEKGYLEEAILNFIALLGWNPGRGSEQEIFSLEELIEKFSLEQVNKAGAVFDIRRLDWMNGEYIKRLSVEELYEKALPFIEKKYAQNSFGTRNAERGTSEDSSAHCSLLTTHFFKRVLTIEKDRLERLDQVGEKNPFFFAAPEYEKELLRWKDMDDATLREMLSKARTVVEKIADSDWTREGLGAILLAEAGDRRGEFLWPLRVALSGAKQSPPPQDIAWVIGKEETLRRIGVALQK